MSGIVTRAPCTARNGPENFAFALSSALALALALALASALALALALASAVLGSLRMAYTPAE